jgi:ATP-dependent 26S proteasome regulatory subunit
LKGRVVQDALDFDALAERTDGFSGADLKGLVQEAGLLAMHDGSFEFKVRHFDEILRKPGRSRAN